MSYFKTPQIGDTVIVTELTYSNNVFNEHKEGTLREMKRTYTLTNITEKNFVLTDEHGRRKLCRVVPNIGAVDRSYTSFSRIEGVMHEDDYQSALKQMADAMLNNALDRIRVATHLKDTVQGYIDNTLSKEGAGE